MQFFQTFQMLVCLLVSPAHALPHDLMVNNELVRDVGVLFSNRNYTGNSTFLLMHKRESKCLQLDPLVLGGDIASVQICVPATCIVYKSKDCISPKSDNNAAYYFEGPIDVENIQNVNIVCESYECGRVEAMAGKIGKMTATTDSQVGHHGPVMSQW